MTKPYDTSRPRSMFAKRHYVWMAKVVQTWPKSVHMQLAYAFYCENTAFKPVRWFQAVGYARDEAEEMHDRIITQFNHNSGD